MALSVALTVIIFVLVMVFGMDFLKGRLEGFGDHWLILFGFVFQWIAILVPLLAVTWLKYGFKWSYFGFQKVSIKTVLLTVLGGYVLYLGINMILSIIIIFSGLKIPGYQIQESLADSFSSTGTAVIIGVLMVTMIAPIIEEVFFRGFIMRTISNKTGLLWGNILSALIFSSLHYPWQSFIPIFILGIIINSMVLRSNSIWPAIAFHMMNNAIAFIFQFSLV